MEVLDRDSIVECVAGDFKIKTLGRCSSRALRDGERRLERAASDLQGACRIGNRHCAAESLSVEDKVVGIRVRLCPGHARQQRDEYNEWK